MIVRHETTTPMNNIAIGLVILAQGSSSVAPTTPSEWLASCVVDGGSCATGSGSFVDDDMVDARLAQDAQDEGPATPYENLRRELGLE